MSWITLTHSTPSAYLRADRTWLVRFLTINCLLSPPKSPNVNLIFISKKQQCHSLLKACASIEHLNQIHAQILTSGLHKDRFLLSEVLKFCALSPLGSIDYARFFLNHAFNPMPASWNFVIRGYSLSDSPVGALLVFNEMRDRGAKPNKLTFPFLLKACARILDLKLGRQIHVEILKYGFESNVYIQNTLIHFYGSCREICDARNVFGLMPSRTIVSWNAILSAYVDNSLLDECLLIFSNMITCDFEPDEATMVVLLSACAEFGNLSLGKWAHCHVIEKGLSMNVRLGTALLNMYAKCGDINCARQIFDKMTDRNVWTWSAMILGLAQHGLATEALVLFSQMKSSSVQPNYVTFLGVLFSCSHAGMVEEGYRFFHDMAHVHGIEPMMTHYGAMVDILGRRGRLKEAYGFIRSMPVEPDPIVWRTLLSACSIHDVSGSNSVGEKVKKKLLELEPKRSGNYVMVANMYAEVGLWEEMANVRRVMRQGGLKKIAGESRIEVGGFVHIFLSGDDSSTYSKVIFQLLDGLNLHMKMIDHVDLNLLMA